MGHLKATSSSDQGKPILILSGSIDEQSQLMSADIPAGQELIIDLGKINRINSSGVREWILWIGQLARTKQITLREIPKIMIDQCNIVSHFFPPGIRIDSFFVPYASNSSDESKTVLFRNGQEFENGSIKQLPKVLDSAGKEMELDVISSRYFSFLSDLGKN